MKDFSLTLSAHIQNQLSAIRAQHSDPLQYAQQSVKVLAQALEKLKAHLLHNPVLNKAQEIEFFREIKPPLAAKLIYYNELYTFEANKPHGQKSTRKYTRAQLKKIRRFYKEHAEFYKYFRTGNRSLDHKYFIRQKSNTFPSHDSAYLQADNRFSTSHDYTLARLLAFEQLAYYLENQLQEQKKPLQAPPNTKHNLTWTGSKVALTELVYALHAASVFNNGQTSLKEVAHNFQAMLGVNLGQFNRTFLEIRARKSERTKFLTALTQRLIRRMDDADEN